jgi:hypothetical protein
MKISFTSNFNSKFKKPELVRNALTKIAYGTMNQIRKLTPVKTGFLRRSESFDIDNHKIVFGASADYAAHVEERSHYLEEGLKSQKENIMTELESAFEGNMK